MYLKVVLGWQTKEVSPSMAADGIQSPKKLKLFLTLQNVVGVTWL